MTTCYINKKIARRLPVVAGRDWPFSLGYHILLVTRHPLVKKASRARSKDLRYVMSEQKSIAVHAVWEDPWRIAAIVINTTKASKVRLIELIVHEVSHCVDAILARCAIETVDTEVRAYLNDWLVGKCLHHFDI